MDPKILSEFLFQESSVLLLILDAEGKILDFNNFAEKYLNAGNQKSVFEIIIDHQNLFKIDDITEEPSIFQLSVNNIYNDPQTFKFTCFKVEDKIYFFGETDFDDNTRMQKEMLLLNNEYAELTRELYKKNAELRKLDELKNQFLGIAAHDLRNPIGNIISIAHLLNDELLEKLEPTQKQFLEVILKLGEFGLNLLNDLLEYSKITTGKRELNRIKANPNVLIKESIKLNEFYARSQGIKLIYSNPGKVDPVLVDIQAFQQILNNLISNAIKFSPENSKVELGLIPGERYHTFLVKDEGPGIPEEDQDKLFKPFYTASVQPRNNEKSTGLGLWIVNTLVHNHGGNIWVESTQGKGTIIYFSLPVEEVSE